LNQNYEGGAESNVIRVIRIVRKLEVFYVEQASNPCALTQIQSLQTLQLLFDIFRRNKAAFGRESSKEWSAELIVDLLAAVALSHDHQVDTIVRLRDREIIQPKQSAVNRGRGFHFKRLLDDVF
jgi:hypothetical protein